MQDADRTSDYLGHMREAIDRALAYTEPFATLTEFAANQQAVDAVARTLENLGEAANRIARSNPQFLEKHPDLPWQEMRTMRNKLIHDYISVDVMIVWHTVRMDLPDLRAKITYLLGQPGS